MSATVAQTTARIRRLIGDTNPTAEEVSAERLLESLNSAVQATLSELAIGESSAYTVTLVAGTDEYSLGGATPPAFCGVGDAIYSYDKLVLQKITPEQMDALKTGTTADTGAPERYTLYERYDNVLRIRIYKTPTATEAGRTLTVWTNPSRVALVLDADTIYMQDALLRGVEKFVAAELVSGLVPDALERRRLNPQIAATWLAQYARAVTNERARLFRLRRQSGVSLVTG